MRPVRPNSRRRSALRTALLALGAIIIGGAGTVAALAGLKIIDPAKLAFWRHGETHPAGYVGVPFCTRLIPAYTEVGREYLTNPKTDEYVMKWLPPGNVPKGIITNPMKILRRVTARDKEPFYPFVESDFLPPGSRPGVEGGTPPGKRAFTFDAAKLKGCVFQVKPGDHIDLLADIPLDKLSWFGGPDAGRPVVLAQLVAHEDKGNKQRTETRMLARDAVVVSPVTTRNRPIVTNSVMQGTSSKTIPVQEVVLAVGEDEIAGVVKAQDWDLPILCAARSGRPEAKDPEPTGPSAVSVPILVREVPAFSELSEADFRDSVTQHIRYGSVSLTEVNRRGIVPNLSDLLGRVVKRHMLVGRMVMEEDLLPPGSPPGITGGIGPDRQAMAIEADKLLGVEDLRAGDRLDVLASFDLGEVRVEKATEKLPDGTVRVIESQVPSFRSSRLSSDASLGGRAEHWYIAIDAELIVPVGTAVNFGNPPAGGAPNEKPTKPQVVIALDTRDMPAMAQALVAKNILLNAVARPAGKNSVTAGKPVAPPGKVAVPVAPKGLPAFEALTKESLINLETRREAWRVLDEQTIAAKHVFKNADSLVGRILKTAKRQGEFFSEEDLLPECVKPGTAAHVPAGKRAVVVSISEEDPGENTERSDYSESGTGSNRQSEGHSEKITRAGGKRTTIEGLEQMTEGTHFDLLVSRPVQFGAKVVVQGAGAGLANRARVAPIVHDGILAYRTPTEAVLAVDAAEVSRLQEALASRAEVRAVVYSAQSCDAKSQPPLAGYDGTEGVSAIEMVIGKTREIHVFGNTK